MRDRSHVDPSAVLTSDEYRAAIEQGARDFRARAAAILASEEAQWSPSVAAALVVETSLSVAEVIAVLSAIRSPERDAAVAARTIN